MSARTLPACLVFLLTIPVLAEPIGSSRLESALRDRDDLVYFTDFESDNWVKDWSVGHRENLKLVDGASSKHLDKSFDGKALEVFIKKGEHYGVSASFRFKEKLGREPEELYVRFYTCFAKDFLDRDGRPGYRGKGPGFDGTYGRAGWGGRPNADGTRGWSCRGGNSATADGVKISFYSYAVQTGNYRYGDTHTFAKTLKPGQWYCVEQYIKLNTPGKKNGIVRAWIDGREVFGKTDLLWRTVDSLKIQSYWINYYRGGKDPASHDHHVYLDNFVIATGKRVGKFTPPPNR